MRYAPRRTSSTIESGRNSTESEMSRFLPIQAEILRQSGVPVDDEMHILSNAYAGQGVYTPEQVATDDAIVAKRKMEYWKKYCAEKGREISFEQYEKESKKNDGERFEQLKTALFSKFLGERAVVCRASLYDDFENGVDNIIIDLKSGEPLCAIDEYADSNSDFVNMPKGGVGEIGKLITWFKQMRDRHSVLQSKSVKVEGVNAGGGAKIKYGLSYKNPNKVPSLQQMVGVPKFLITLPPYLVDGTIKGFKNDSEKSPGERIIMQMLLNEIIAQAEINITNRDIPEALKVKMRIIKEFLIREHDIAKSK